VLASTGEHERHARRNRRNRPCHRGHRGRGRQHQAHRQHADRPPDSPQVTPGEFLAGGIQQRRQHDQADHIGWHADLRHTREQAGQQPRDHQQRGSRDTQLPGESRDHGAQHYQQQHRLDTAHASNLASSNHPMNADQASRRTTCTVAEAAEDPQAAGKLAFKWVQRPEAGLAASSGLDSCAAGRHSRSAGTRFPASRIYPDTCDSSPTLVSLGCGVPGSLVGV
jgi:hypothetical protein